MEGKLIKDREHYYLTVDNKIFADIDGHPLKAITNKLSLKNCEAIANGYDLDELVKSKYPNVFNEDYEYYSESEMLRDEYKSRGFYEGAKAILELLGDKKFSEEHLRRAYSRGKDLTTEDRFKLKEWDIFTNFVDSLQQTEWKVEIEMESNLHIGEVVDESYPKDFPLERPKLDANGCIILKRK